MKKNSTKFRLIIVLLTLVVYSTAFAQRPFFNKSKDILIAQFDSKPDPDDIHAQAALGSMIAHSDFNDVRYYAVAGAIGKQGGRFIDSDNLFDMAFGNNWTDANANWNASVTRIKNRVLPILQNGGKAWVMEAGQSNITADWVAELISVVGQNTVKNNVIVVQHSDWNQDMTTPADLAYVRNRTSYFAIDDGNAPYTAGWGDRGPWQTGEYRSKDKKWMTNAKASRNSKAKELWTEADRVVQAHGHLPSHSFISVGGVDFSDTIEAWWILNIGNNADSVTKFWNRYVTNTTGGNTGGGGTVNSFYIVNSATGKKLRPQNNTSGASLIQVQASATDNFVKWTQVPSSNGFFYLKNVATGMFFRPANDDNGAKIEQRPNTWRGAYTQWQKINTSGGNFYLKNRKTQLYFRPTNDDNNSTMVQRPTSYSGSYTQWSFKNAASKSKSLDKNSNEVSIFPNPAVDGINVSVDKNSINASINVYSFDGKLVKQATAASLKTYVNLSSIANGIYIVNIVKEGEILKASKLIKN